MLNFSFFECGIYNLLSVIPCQICLHCSGDEYYIESLQHFNSANYEFKSRTNWYGLWYTINLVSLR